MVTLGPAPVFRPSLGQPLVPVRSARLSGWRQPAQHAAPRPAGWSVPGRGRGGGGLLPGEVLPRHGGLLPQLAQHNAHPDGGRGLLDALRHHTGPRVDHLGGLPAGRAAMAAMDRHDPRHRQPDRTVGEWPRYAEPRVMCAIVCICLCILICAVLM